MRINDPAIPTATAADIKAGNYFVLDGAEGTKKLDAKNVAKAADVTANQKYSAGIVERLNSGASFEIGTYVSGKKADDTKRMRTKSALIPPFAIELKPGYTFVSAHRLDNEGNYLGYDVIANNKYKVETNNGQKYLLTVAKTNGATFDGSEDFVEYFVYDSFSDILKSKKSLNGVIERVNGGLATEIGGYITGRKDNLTNRLRFSTPLIPPFSFTLKPGYKTRSVQWTDNEGNYLDYDRGGWRSSYSVDENDGRKYLVTFFKSDDSDFDGSEEIFLTLKYNGLSDLTEGSANLPLSKTNSCNIFARVGVIGDSYAAGYIRDDESPKTIASDFSWPAFMQRKTGRTWTNWAKSGSTTKSWVTNVQDLSNIDEITREGNKCQAYVIGLQINDIGADNPYRSPAGTIADAGTDADTYCAWLYKLIQICVTANDMAKIFVCTLPNAESHGYNAIVRQVVQKCKNEGVAAYCADLAMYEEFLDNNETFVNDASYGHYTAIGYQFMSDFLFAVISKIIDENGSEFKDVYKIPYDVQ